MAEQIEQAYWESFLDNFTKTHHGVEARLEVINADWGDQESATWLPFSGISYDPHHRQIFVSVGGISSRYPVHLTHRIDHPKMVAVYETATGETQSLLVVAEDKTKTLVSLRRQPQLTA